MSTLENGNVRKVLFQNQENIQNWQKQLDMFQYNFIKIASATWEGKGVKGENQYSTLWKL